MRNYLEVAQYMAFAVFVTLAFIHWLIWFRARRERSHLLFAITALTAAANAIAEAWMYQADSLERMSSALRWYVATSGCWMVAAILFIESYSQVGRIGKRLVKLLVGLIVIAWLINLFSPHSFLYTELTGLREITLPWGEQIRLAVGDGNPLRLVFELTIPMVFALVAMGSYQFWLRGEHTRAVTFGSSVFLFVLCFGTHAFLVDTGILDSPYLSTYGFLALVALTSYDLAGEVVRSTQLSSELRQTKSDLRTAVVDERIRIAGELHDSVTQTLFSSAAIADALPEVWKRRPDEAFRGLDDLKRLSRAALAEMRSLLLELHPAAIVDRDLSVLLKQLADAATARTRVPIDLKVEGRVRLPPEVQVVFYRAAQESINNVIRHAEAERIWVSLNGDGPEAVVQIRDDGRGFVVTETNPGMGLRFMRERVESIGGVLTIDSELARGTTVTVRWHRNARKMVHDDN